ncbi:MAG: hypothetical protein J0L84_10505 [Verrucomicrobia bacterium]|nr:hypothetical protein [Verrucomicrobiota bacterium]
MPIPAFLRCRWTGLATLCAAVLTAQAGTYKSITIDGSFGDWAGVPVAHEDPADSTDSADYRRIYLANDDDYLYVRFTLERPADPFLSNANLFLDSDANPDTGFRLLLGSEMLIQGGSGYDERTGGFNEGGVNNLGWLSAPAGEATEFEARIARGANYATDGAPVFIAETIALLLEAEDANFARKETAPDTEGLGYTFAPAPPPLTAPVVLASLTGTSWRVNDAGADLGTEWREPGFDTTGEAWRDGSGLFGYTDAPGAYPAAIATPLAPGARTVYLRTTFSWDSNPANLVFAVSNLLSDGAVIYLNGAEVRRIRLPQGGISFDTAATGGPVTAGAVEVFGVSGAPLVSGDNVLAVELHQAVATPSDLVFGLSLHATPDFPVRLVDVAEPADRAVVAGETVRLTAEVLGTPPLTYEWRKDGTLVEGATGDSLTFDPVLQTDEGGYSLKVTNPGGSVTTRVAALSVTVTPVTFTDASRPADVTVFEGAAATFEVSVAGSPPITYQWLKDGFPIEGATGASYTLPAVLPEHGGDYGVQIRNPATPSLLSRMARLVVLVDRDPPTLSSVAGSPNLVTVTFSEPVDPVTAADKSRYQLDGGLTVTAAAISLANPAVVALTTSKQTLFSGYTLTVTGVKDRFGNVIPPGAEVTFRSTVAVDGSFADWTDVPLAHSDPSEPPTAGTDFKDLWVTNDELYLYVRFTLHSPGNPGTFLNNIFLDADFENPGYGTSGIGSEMLIQQGAGYQQKNGGFNEGGINGLDFAMNPEGEGTEFELRISRGARYAGDQVPVFVAETIRFFLETENSSFVTTDTAPDSGGLEYTFVALPPVTAGPLTIRTVDGRVVLTWPGAGQLQKRDSLGAGDWTEVPDAASGIEITPSGATAYYRLVL